MNRLRASMLAIVIILVGCQSVANYQANLQAWVGQSEQNLEASWGSPSSITMSGDLRLISYFQNDGAYVQGGYWAGRVMPLYCNTTFTIQNDIVIQAQFVGNECQSY